MQVCSYALQVWRNNVLRNLVFSVIGYIEEASFRLKGRIEGIGTVLRYRMQYENITRPMKYQYLEMRKKR